MLSQLLMTAEQILYKWDGCQCLTGDFSVGLIEDTAKGEDLGNVLNDIIRPTVRSRPLFAYTFAEVCLAKGIYLKSGWNVYSAEEEYYRQNVVNNGWRITKINEGYKLCRTYPEVLTVPVKVSDDLLIQSAPHRAHGRLPVLSWLHPESRASLTRSAQPMTGIHKRRNDADEDLIRCIREANANTVNLLVFDARPHFTAVANRGRGGGVENPAYYKNIQYSFMNIPNIHAMRASFSKLLSAVTSSAITSAMMLTQQSLSSHSADGLGEGSWLKSVHDTKWLYNIQQILSAAAAAADQIENHKSSILVHCSDGWDRTPQITSLAMLMLDPYYRTLRGFQVLIEKEWISFGHKFCERTGGPADGGNLIFPQSAPSPSHTTIDPLTDSRSPIFLQFIDCVWQMMVQFPASFEFNESLLTTIMDELYAARFGTFLFDSECLARDNYARSQTISLWGYINTNARDFMNPTYTPAEVSGHRLLMPCAAAYRLELWRNYFLRWQPSMRCQEPVVARNAKMLDRMLRFRRLTRERRGLDSEKGSPPRQQHPGDDSAEKSTERRPVEAPPPRRIFPRFPISNSSSGPRGGGEEASLSVQT